jgi:hypothetical protein
MREKPRSQNGKKNNIVICQQNLAKSAGATLLLHIIGKITFVTNQTTKNITLTPITGQILC